MNDMNDLPEDRLQEALDRIGPAFRMAGKLANKMRDALINMVPIEIANEEYATILACLEMAVKFDSELRGLYMLARQFRAEGNDEAADKVMLALKGANSDVRKPS